MRSREASLACLSSVPIEREMAGLHDRGAGVLTSSTCWAACIIVVLAILCSDPSVMKAVESASPITDYVYGLCNTASYSPNSTFALNLNKVYGTLLRESARTLYASDVAADTPDNDTHVYGMYQCRGDLSPADCRTCVSAIMKEAVCSTSVGMRVLLQGCYLRYEAYDYLTVPEVTLVTTNCSEAEIGPGSAYPSHVAGALKKAAAAAPAHPGFGFAAAQEGSSGTGDAAYALTQCVGYTTPSECSTCLSQVSSYTSFCGNSIAGQVYFVTCYFLYSPTPILFN